MAEPKRYYWMKLKESFMTSDTIDYFMSQKDGANYVVLYQMLCLKTINTAGRLERQIGELIIPYDVEKIYRDCKWFSMDTIRVALKLYQAVGLIYEEEGGTLVMSDHKNLVGSETSYAAQKRNQRALKKQSVPQIEGHSMDRTVDSGVDNVHPEIEIRDRDKSLEIREKEGERETEEEEPLPSFTGDLERAFQDWLAYKKERRESYKPTGLKSLIGQIRNNAEKYGEQAVIEVIRSSMASNYQGIVFDRLKKGGNGNGRDGKDSADTGEKRLYGRHF